MFIVIFFFYVVYEYLWGVWKDGMCNEYDDDEELWSFIVYICDLELIRKCGL